MDYPQNEPSTSEVCEEVVNSRHPQARISKLLPVYRMLLFIYMIAHVSCSGKSKCFNTDKGMSIEGGEYRRIRNANLRECATECRDDFSCLAYEWLATEQTCLLKSRSTTGPLVKKDDAIIGFCIDEEDEVRDRFRDHMIVGPVVVQAEDVAGEDCRDYCANQPTALIYSWKPNEAMLTALAAADEDDEINEESVLGENLLQASQTL
ncbi:unnamed protein product [Caenorhabditis auriculariae]|uniref:Apple domain-containing protein n=1 Tax=Caenorhabditis auriculariae TaxID=2777116 RepID=A0A8S1HAW8_9PELO|nr:unnamed protein product [Caenorhabditis auriculariae]